MTDKKSADGHFVWHEIMSKNPTASAKFYSSLFGWTTKEEKMEMGPYTMFFSGESMLGGIQPLPDDAPAPTHWLSYVSVPDVDASMTMTKELGGNVLMAAMDMPTVGRFGVIADAQGGVISPYKSEKPMEAPDPAKTPANGFLWMELLTHDEPAAVEFYKKVMGWTVEPWDMGEAGTYQIMKAGDVSVCGIMQMPAEAEAPTHWLPYLGAADVDATAAKAEKLGGKIVMPARDIPQVGRIAVLLDDQGAAFALFKPAPQS